MFVSGILSYFGKENEASSPTFTIVNEHELTKDLNLFHFDVYRFDFDEKYHCYCQILNGNDVCFFDFYSDFDLIYFESVLYYMCCIHDYKERILYEGFLCSCVCV